MTIDVARLVLDETYWHELGAPDDATHFLPDNPSFAATWYKKGETDWLGQVVEDPFDVTWDPCPNAIALGWQLIPRPVPKH